MHRGQLRWILLLLASYSFYTLWQPEPALLLALSTLATYVCALGLGRDNPARGRVLVLGVLFNLGLLFVFKYTDFFLASLQDLIRRSEDGADFEIPALKLVLPVGLSFYTFSAVSYLVDVYRGKMEAERHLGRFATYVAFFPKIFAGPIDRAITFLPQLKVQFRFDAVLFAEGLQLFLWGLFKKVVIADRLAPFVDAAYASPAYAPTVSLILAAYFYAFQIYCDFSGYTDMARGTAKVLGFDLMENFARPYLAKSAAEFWAHRWHLSLCTWFRDYMYIPMGGNRTSRPRHIFNLLAVFAASGLWHGANWTFIVWGMLNGLYLCAGLATRNFGQRMGAWFPRVGASLFWRVSRILLTFHLIAFAWIFFRAASLADAWTIINRIARSWNLVPTLFSTYAWPPEVLLSMALIAALIALELFDEARPLWDRLRASSLALRWGFNYGLIFGLLILGNWQLKQFIYMQF